ncbi:high affinity immunoglobulin gamma Fc receptor I-like [Sinocyclocheilus rhinocerous]|uniref:high affinity immunoglobulin gamma Fc receptor I-like n=1 Tax=Sinocyclocheilus rhinocerous TaxID=307959 RepID=UPI0007B79447|nr:PREDICTED: high affinity immunoglobulin gamma Fc receptor I-like [Sinocyclocheilus rhinocerous]
MGQTWSVFVVSGLMTDRVKRSTADLWGVTRLLEPSGSFSNTQPLWITGVSPSVSLLVSPSRSQHFSSDSLSLSCEDQSNSTGWTVRRYTDRNTEDCSKLTGSTCRIDSLNTSDAGVYWCQSESGEKRHPLNITVHDGDVILLSSVDPVIEGDTLTLHCLHRSTNSPILRADFYKDGSLVQNQTTGEMNITTVSKSHEGLYYCKTERGQSLHSWISVRVSGSVFNILSFLLAACPYLLATVVLLFKCYRAKSHRMLESQAEGWETHWTRPVHHKTNTHTFTLSLNLVSTSPVLQIRLWEKPNQHMENKQTPHRKASCSSSTSKQVS